MKALRFCDAVSAAEGSTTTTSATIAAVATPFGSSAVGAAGGPSGGPSVGPSGGATVLVTLAAAPVATIAALEGRRAQPQSLQQSQPPRGAVVDLERCTVGLPVPNSPAHVNVLHNFSHARTHT